MSRNVAFECIENGSLGNVVRWGSSGEDHEPFGEMEGEKNGQGKVTAIGPENSFSKSFEDAQRLGDDQISAKKPRSVDVSVIIAVRNVEKFIRECLDSIALQTFDGTTEVSIYFDGSTDSSETICKKWAKSKPVADSTRLSTVMSGEKNSLGAGPARNRAIKQSTGRYLCIQDADDVMLPKRIELQYAACVENPYAIVGSFFERIPADATERYTAWCNSLTQEKLMVQRFRELTLIQPTWFFARDIWQRINGYIEEPNDGRGRVLAEDLDFFYRHIDYCCARNEDPALYIVEEKLVKYRNHEGCSSWRTPRKLLFQIKAAALERSVLSKWKSFTIWGAGRDGKALFTMLSPETRRKVAKMCDIDKQKIRTGYHNRDLKTTVPVVHFSEAKPPIICCVALNRGGEFEKNLSTLNLREGIDYFHFV